MLTAISSFRPLNDNGEVAFNQIRALRSWDAAFSEVYLCSPHEPRLASPKTTFVDVEDFPRLSLLMLLGAEADGPSAILNADIVVASHLRRVAELVWMTGASAFTSRRYEFDSARADYESAKLVDMGADFFCAQPHVWWQAWREIPTAYRIGNGGWDNWLLGYLTTMLRRKFVDVTPYRLIFHPKHTERKRVPMEQAPRDRYLASGVGFPPQL